MITKPVRSGNLRCCTPAQALLKTSLGYPPVAGTPELQALVAKWHGAQPDDVLVTVGCSEVHA